jgi:hypothetical protein
MKKMKKLNESFSQWADRQIKENPIAVWKDGVKVQICFTHFCDLLKLIFFFKFFVVVVGLSEILYKFKREIRNRRK